MESKFKEVWKRQATDTGHCLTFRTLKAAVVSKRTQGQEYGGRDRLEPRTVESSQNCGELPFGVMRPGAKVQENKEEENQDWGGLELEAGVEVEARSLRYPGQSGETKDCKGSRG